MSDAITQERRPFLIPTLTKQCWGFMIGSALFAIGSAPGFGGWAGASVANLLYFVGAIFFTGAGLIQLFLSGAVSVPVAYAPGRMVRAEWLTASTQSFGTVLFNVSTTAALYAKSTGAQEHYVWNPDAAGSVAFLVSGWLAFVAYSRTAPLWDPTKVGWWATLINFIGCVAFGLSAVGSITLSSGQPLNAAAAGWGTFIGALCFFFVSLIVLPAWNRRATSVAASR